MGIHDDFTAADIDLSCRAANLQGNARLRHHDIGLSSISSGAVSPGDVPVDVEKGGQALLTLSQ